MILCSYAGLRGAVGMSLALMVAASEEVPTYIQDVILLHVAGVALLTLLINATTTAALVRYLGLSKYSDLKKNILVGLTCQFDRNVDKNIEVLKQRSHFNYVEWQKLRESVRLSGLKGSLKQFKNIHLEGVSMIDYSDISNPLRQIDDFNRKVYEA